MSEASRIGRLLFVGWSGQVPRPWRTFIFCVAVAVLGGLGIAGVALSSSVDFIPGIRQY